MKAIILSLVLVFLLIFRLNSQNIHQTISASGGNAIGTGGKVSYSVGQVFYNIKSGHNGTVAEGVQQPYEISVITGFEYTKINLHISVYPNPVSMFLVLKVSDIELISLIYQLFDINGKLLETKDVNSVETLINLSALSKGIYLLNVSKPNSLTIKSFKIIKN